MIYKHQTNSYILFISIISITLTIIFGGGKYYSYCDWSVGKGDLKLIETLRVGDDESYFFGSINDLAVRSDGRIYMADARASHVKVLAPDGALQDTIGRGGLGPGEFNRPTDVFLARGDSLYILDADYRGNLSVFTPGHEFAYRTSLLPGPDAGSFSGRPGLIVHTLEEAGYLVAYSSSPHPGEGLDEGLRDYVVRNVSPGGTPRDTLLTYPPGQQYVEIKDGGGLYIAQIPFSRTPTVRGGPEGNVHYAWSDSLVVQIYGAGGKLRRIVDVPFEPVPVTQADRERELSKGDKEWQAKIRHKIPKTKPAFDHFLVDDEGRYWFGRPTAHPDTTAWWVADPAAKRVVTARLPSAVEFMTVRDGFAYGRSQTEAGVPVLVRYRIRSGP